MSSTSVTLQLFDNSELLWRVVVMINGWMVLRERMYYGKEQSLELVINNLQLATVIVVLMGSEKIILCEKERD